MVLLGYYRWKLVVLVSLYLSIPLSSELKRVDLTSYSTGQLPPRELNLDVLSLIVEFLGFQRDIIAFTTVCRSFRTLGAPGLVRRVSIGSPRKLQSFHAFMRSNLHPTHRHFRFFEEFHMSANMIHEPHSTILSDLLSSATHLRIIHFKEFDQLLRLDANLLSVMCNLPRLSEAYLYGIRGEALGAQWLKRASSPVSVLCTDAIWTSVASAGSMRTNTLTKLFLSLVDMPSMDAVFPTVHTLLLFSQACIPSALIFRAFPNLRICEYRRDYDTEHDYEWGRNNFDNRNLLEKLSSKQSLPTLDMLVGDSHILDAAAMICKTKKLILDFEIHDYNYQEAFCIIHECSPPILRLTIRACASEASEDESQLEPFIWEIHTVPIEEIWLSLNLRRNRCEFEDGVKILVGRFPHNLRVGP